MESPKGKLIPIGGKEARAHEAENTGDARPVKFENEGVLQEVLDEMKGADSKVAVITTASGEPEEMGDMYLETFGKLGCKQVTALNLTGRNVNSKKTLEILGDADGLFFTGGDQTKLIDKICDTRFMDVMKDRYQNEDFVIAGTSAGAMAMSAAMIMEGSSTESLLKGIVELTRGFTLLPKTIIDTHFMSRGRFSRLAEALLVNPGFIAIGICEDTSLVVTGGNHMRTIGSGVAMILEADSIKKTNFKEAKKMQPIYVEGMQMHILAQGASFSLSERKMILEKH
ncbi:Cyanophycinase [Dyadobacter sp. CECT 9623]|uniref:Cyanophycinase n=1 Tax=Dyadobacter linearis TaxID=2823330 RepID=A0ABN7R5Q5_9BACT|nr:cyanophycinase [Dyadobacter sp. CECT 9623]CAG5067439.1 Cyanophycinase [Dyadobacter sp. CECT 9623]